MAQLPDHLREFDDTDKTRELIYDNTLEALKTRFPIEDDTYRLELIKPYYEGSKTFTMAQQKQALLTGRQLRTPIKGKWRLVDKASNSVLDERDDTIMQVPYYTKRGTIIHNGNEYSISNQSRLKPGVYVRRQRTGDIQAQINVTPGTGRGFRIGLEPATGIFKLSVGQSSIPIYPLMQALGVSDKDMVNTWGAELAAANMNKRDTQAIGKLYMRFAGTKADPLATPEAKMQYLRDSLSKAAIDKSVVARTLGLTGVEGITPQVLLRTTQKMLGVSRGEEEPDDRDSPMYSSVHSVEDFIPERIVKDAGKLARTLLWKARRNKSLKAIPRAALNPYMENLVLNSGLAMPLEETNPISTLEQMLKLTKMGEGGIGSTEAVTDEARNVNNGQMGFIDPIAGPESLSIGIDTRIAYKTYKGRDNQLYAEFKDPTGKINYLTPSDVYDRAVAFPGELSKKGRDATVIKSGKIQTVPKDQVEFEVPSLAHMFSSNANLNPMPTGVMPGRQFYAAKYWSQYMPLVEGEAPLVDSLSDDGKTTFTEYYGRRIGAHTSKTGGKVVDVNEDAVVVRGDDGKKYEYDLVKDFPFNRISGITYTPTVQVGDTVNVGDMVAHSNFTDKKTGAISTGRNLKAAFIPFRGESIEDAYVISETAAKKLTNERLYGFDLDTKGGVSIAKNRYISLFPDEFKKDQIEKIGPDGVILPGSIVNTGDPIILGVGPKLLSSADAQLGRLHKVLKHAHTDKAVVWEAGYPGVVTDAVMNAGGARVNIKAAAPVQVADKLATRSGLKGVTGSIVPDDQMPRDAVTNEPYEVLMNTMGVQSRVAPNQMIEMQLGKVAKITGQQIRLPQTPPEEGWAQWAINKLAETNVKEATDLFDPATGKTIKNVADGYVYISPMHHIADKKLSARGEEGAYTVDEQPAKGGSEGSKRYSMHDVMATLAHDSPDVLKDALMIRGSKNDEYWRAYRSGRSLPEPKVPFIYDKFLNLLRAGGINVRDKGRTVSILPMVDKDILEMSKGAIEKSSLISYDFEPIAGGLFDVGKTGGTQGNRWTHVALVEPVPNPVMEEPIRRVLGLTVNKLRDIVAGREQLNGLSGGTALKAALEGMDVDAEIKKRVDQARTLRGANRDNAIKVVGYLTSMKKQGLAPKDWMLSNVPVLPPIFRPISRLGDIPLKSDLNDLYVDLVETNNNLRTLRKELPDTALSEERLNLYDSVAAAVGLGEPITQQGQSKRLKGAIRQVIGTSPKQGLFQSRVASKTVSGVGRGVITPEPNFDMDTIGVPEDSAWKLYKDFVMRRLVQRGFPTVTALEMIENRTPEASHALDTEMSSRPIIADRAPTWHRFNLMAFYPKRVEGSTLRLSPLIVKGFNADFDGDQMNFHVPVTDKAVEQAKRKMLPSKNLFSLTDLRSIRHAPAMELTLGLYQLTRPPTNKEPRRYATTAEARKAYLRGEIELNDPITVG